ncbi:MULTISPECIES: hypothetical protein [unclassified Roseateles]|jgi:hypothetical protein|uniref:hypothetical protein n=1 Tax=unclassified Roseateles TaxID=2626991 RepID=UPI0006F74132|nr:MULTISPECIES: hypothetical protein [unclassified Roseateles]KQW45718.1 hypothetical protein ASC81_12570 [Pelomonas sp. Root405]KRA72562.1 hypothetical protein ASD88_12570 [Pelomonas sp. Root662]
MLRRLLLLLTLFAGLTLAPLARAGQPCCEQGCDAMPACAAICSICVSPAALPLAEPVLPRSAAACTRPATVGLAFDDWTDEIWNPPD